MPLALASLRKTAADIIFLDYRLGSVTGDELAQRLDPAIPKYLITGDQAVKTIYNFVEIVEKPYPISRVRSILNKLLQKRIQLNFS